MAVVYSYEEAQTIEEMKMRDLERCLEQGLKQFTSSKSTLFDGNAVARICAKGRKRAAASKKELT